MSLSRDILLSLHAKNPGVLIISRIRVFITQANKKPIRIVSIIILLTAVHYPLTSSPEPSQSEAEEQQSILYSLVPDEAVSWSTMDLLIWQMSRTDAHLLNKKRDFISGYSNIIKAAADEFEISPVLLAGISWREFGGDPEWIDNVAFLIRQLDHATDTFNKNVSVTRNAEQTSFGNVSIQIRRAADILGYNSNKLSHADKNEIINALEDPVHNIFIAAHHLADLSRIDFPDKRAADLSLDDLKIVATRFYRGPELSLDQIKADMQYGENVLKRFELLNALLESRN